MVAITEMGMNVVFSFFGQKDKIEMRSIFNL
jgi:hypothetical protein